MGITSQLRWDEEIVVSGIDESLGVIEARNTWESRY
jgi:hypothetical protein